MSKIDEDEIKTLLIRLASKADETKDSIACLDKKLDLHIQKTEYELKRINELDDVQNRLLDQHIEGVNTLKKMYEAHEADDLERFQKLEAPRRWAQFTVKVFITVGSIAAAVAGIAKLLQLF